MSGFKLMAAVQMTDALKKVTVAPLPRLHSDRVRAIGVSTPRTRFSTQHRRPVPRGTGTADGAL